MQADLTKISSLVSQQFPDFYQEEGSNFIQFVKAYYEWMDDQGPILKSRKLLQYADIDEVSDEYIDYFLSKFMYGIPKSVLSDKALLEKHILDVYRSKGSVEGLKLLFRLLYDLEVKLFTPQEDVLRTSDGKWVRRQYIEVEERESNSSYSKKIIRGTTSGASAYVTIATKIYTGSIKSDVFYIEDILLGPSGSSFIIGEYLVYDGLDIRNATLIKGSATGVSNVVSSENHSIGDSLSTNSVSGEGIKFDVSTVQDSAAATGYISFKLIDGGYGYAIDSPVTVSYLTASTGSGAAFKVKSLANTSVFRYNTNDLVDEMSTLISATSFSANLKLANVSSIINNAFTDANLTIGKIASIGAVTSGDHNYNGSVQAQIFEKRIWGYNILDSNGNFWGNNAVVIGPLAVGNGVIDTVELLASGFGFNVEGEKVVFTNDRDQTATVELTLTTSAIGVEEGQWADESGFLNSDKYIHDSDYYQEFSYEIQLEKSLDKYINVLKQIFHPVGNRVFGKPIIIDTKQLQQNILVDSITTVT